MDSNCFIVQIIGRKILNEWIDLVDFIDFIGCIGFIGFVNFINFVKFINSIKGLVDFVFNFARVKFMHSNQDY